MHLNHVVLATALALFVSNDGVVTAGNMETVKTHAAQVDQDEMNDTSSSSSPVHAAVIASKTSKTKPVKKPDSDSNSDEDDNMESTSGSSEEDSDSNDSSDSSKSMEMSGSSELDDDMFSMNGSDGFDTWLKSLGSKKKRAKTPASDSSSGDDSNMESSWGSDEDDSSSDDWASPSKSGSGSDLISGSLSLDDLFSTSGSGGFDAWLKSLGGLGLTSSDSSTDGDSDFPASTKAPKKTKKAEDKSASGSSDSLNFDDFFADMKGSGPGGDLGGLLNPSGGGKAIDLGTSSQSGSSSQNVSPKCEEGWWSNVKSWFGGWIHKSTKKDCEPAARRLRAD